MDDRIRSEAGTKCGQANCNKPAAYGYEWPGRGFLPICGDCAPIMLRVTAAVGMDVPLIPLGEAKLLVKKR